MQPEVIIGGLLLALARARLPGLRYADPDATPVVRSRDGLRGSGSWANEWSGVRDTVARVGSQMGFDTGRRTSRRRRAIQPKPLMCAQDAQFHTWLADRMEIEAPTYAVHTNVGLPSFLATRQLRSVSDAMQRMTVNFLITDPGGQPIAVLLRDHPAPDIHLLRLRILLEAGLPVLDMTDPPQFTALWSRIEAILTDL